MIEEYLTEFLYPRLESFGLDEQQQLTVIEDVRNRLLSLANKWNDGYFRKTILLTGLEEATFYEPGNTDLEIRAFVVCTIRNSLIEDIHSDETNNPKLKTINMPNPSDIIDVTEEAVNFFSKADFNEMQNNDTSYQCIYKTLPAKYPATWQALGILATETNTWEKFTPVNPSLPNISLKDAKAYGVGCVEIHQSGIDPLIGEQTKSALKIIEKKEVEFLFNDCFKSLSRNIDKLFKIIEFTLYHNIAFLTHNYYIGNGYVARRTPLLRPMHMRTEMIEKFKETKGLRAAHRKALTTVYKGCFG